MGSNSAQGIKRFSFAMKTVIQRLSVLGPFKTAYIYIYIYIYELSYKRFDVTLTMAEDDV